MVWSVYCYLSLCSWRQTTCGEGAHWIYILNGLVVLANGILLTLASCSTQDLGNVCSALGPLRKEYAGLETSWMNVICRYLLYLTVHRYSLWLVDVFSELYPSSDIRHSASRMIFTCTALAHPWYCFYTFLTTLFPSRTWRWCVSCIAYKYLTPRRRDLDTRVYEYSWFWYLFRKNYFRFWYLGLICLNNDSVHALKLERTLASWYLLGAEAYIRSSSSEVTDISSVVNHGSARQRIALYTISWVCLPKRDSWLCVCIS